MKIVKFLLVFEALSIAMLAQVAGTGTPNRVAIWTDSTTIGNSAIVQAGGKVAIGTNGPAATLHVVGANAGGSANAVMALKVSGGQGGSLSNAGGTGGSGGSLQLISGLGGAGGGFGGGGASMLLTGGNGGRCVPASTRCAPLGGNGGSILLQPGISGGSGGRPGNVVIASGGGHVGIATASPSATFEIGPGGSTLADAWTTRSSARFKTNVQPLFGALAKLTQLQGVSYDSKLSGKHEIGMIAEDVERVLPQIVSRDGETNEVQGIDYSRLSALLVEALKTQQSEIDSLKQRLQELESSSAHK
jgi:hypothetical protein